MAQSVSALNAAIPLSSDYSTFTPKSKLVLPILKSLKPKPTGTGSIMSVASGRDLDHLQRSTRRPEPAPVVGLWDRFPTTRTVITDPLSYAISSPTTPQTQNSSYSRGRTPWEIKERESEYKVRFDMPGMTKDDVKVWVEENMLIIHAEKAPKKKITQSDNNIPSSSTNADVSNGNAGTELKEEDEEEEWPAKSFGRYRSMIALPENIQFEKIRAEVKDGVVYITIPKAVVSAKVLEVPVQ